MKKIFYSLSTLLFLASFANTQNNLDEITKVLNTAFTSNIEATKNTNQALNPQDMPSDEMIMGVLKNLNYPIEQQELLFKNTKLQLQKLYGIASPDAQLEGIIPNQENMEQMPTANEPLAQPQSEKRVKKYSKHAPLTRRSKTRRNYD